MKFQECIPWIRVYHVCLGDIVQYVWLHLWSSQKFLQLLHTHLERVTMVHQFSMFMKTENISEWLITKQWNVYDYI